jgi:glutamate/tyrosine decarboxylase-like PLP-dependent enzyme
MTADAVWQALHNLRQRDLPAHGGRALSSVFDSGIAEAEQLGREVLASFAGTDGGDTGAYPSWIRMEQDLLALASRLLDGPLSVVGNVTSGGSESAFLAVQAARDARPDLVRPTVVLPVSAHPCYLQAARYLRVEPVLVDVDPESCRADVAAVAGAVTDRTVLVVASAPSPALGVVDHVPEIAALADSRGIRCHVDAGLGGWLLPYLSDDGPDPDRDPDAEPVPRVTPAYSFAVPGVTSISVDLHRYAYTPKGASVLLHRTAELRRPQLFASAGGFGLPLVGSTTQATRSGGPLAAAWAVTRFLGDHNYARLAGSVRTGADAIAAGVESFPNIRLLARPDAGVLTVVAAPGRCDVFTVSDELASRGWQVQPQLSFGAIPPTLRLVLSAATVPRVPEFLDALKASVKTATGAGTVRLPRQLVAAIRTLDLRTFDDTVLDQLLPLVGIDPRGALMLPERMAPVHAMLDVASGRVRQELLVALVDRQSRPRG